MTHSGHFWGIFGVFLCYDESLYATSGDSGRNPRDGLGLWVLHERERGRTMRYTFGDYILDTQRQELHHAGEPVKLRRKVFQVLVYLLAHRERVVPKQELLEHLWPDQFVGDEALRSCMKALRHALEERGRTPRFLRTLHGQGYRFVAAVAAREPRPADAAPHALPLPEAEGATHQAELPSHALAPPRADPDNTPWEALEGEYKQVTVLCGALAEALMLAVRLGAEAMHHLMRDVLALA